MPVTSHGPVNFSVCLANIVAHWTCMTGHFFYNKMRIRSAYIFSFSRSSKPCKHCALSFKWNVCSSNYTYALYIVAHGLINSLLPLLKTIVLSITVQILSIHASLCGDHLFPQTKMVFVIATKTIGSGSVQRKTRARLRMIILFRM